MSKFISLVNRTHFSILQALPSVEEYFARAAELGQEAIGICDYSTFSGVWDAYKASKKANIKLIVGATFYFVDDVNNKSAKLRYVTLLAKNAEGYKNILALNREAFDHSSLILKRVLPIIDWKLLQRYSAGTICLTGCGNGIVGQHLNNRKFEDAENALSELINIFGTNLGIEVQAHNLDRNPVSYLDRTNQQFTNVHMIRLAAKYNLRVVPTCNSHYLKKEDAEVHDVLLAVGAMQPVYSNARLKYNVSDLYLKSHDEIKAFFARNYSEEFAESIIANTKHFADLCETPDWINPKYSSNGDKEYPVFDVKAADDFKLFQEWLEKQSDKVKSSDEDSAYLRFRCEEELKKRIPEDKRAKYTEQLEEELEVFDLQKFSSYMLITADILSWARKNSVSVGLGRGSGGGSLVAYLLDIHKADPIKYGLIFARFQNRERTAPPDLDNDVSTSGREKVIKYIIDKYGSDNVVSISNFNRITPKVYVRDVARSTELGGSRQEAVKIGNNLADMIPDEIKTATDISQFEGAPLFFEYMKRYPELAKYGKVLGQYRALSTHAGGVVIGKRPLAGLVPLRKDKDNAVCVEFEKNNTEDIGLLKMDILGVTNLDVVDKVLDLIKFSGKEMPTKHLDFDCNDPKTYELISSGNNYGVFQLGTSKGTIGLCKAIKPKNIEDLAIITALARPASKGIRDAFIATRAGKRQFKLLHPSLKNAFEHTYGFGLFDESILQLARDVAGWSMHSADRIRKMIKDKGKNKNKIVELRSEFIEGAVKNGIEREMAIRIWDEEVQKFATYTFNKSHAVLYSLFSYTTAYLKAHYPLEFLVANLMFEVKSNAPGAEDNAKQIKKEIRDLNIKILPPNINTSDITYKIQSDGSLLTGFEGIKYAGTDAIIEILEKRPFKSFDDFMNRTSTTAMRSPTIQALAASGALDCFGLSRRQMFLYCQDYREKLRVWNKKHAGEQFQYSWNMDKEWNLGELAALEIKYMGESFVANKKQIYPDFFDGKAYPFKLVRDMGNKQTLQNIKAEIKTIFEFKVKKEGKFYGKEMIKCVIEDEYGDQLSMTIFPDKWKEVQARIKELSKNKFKFEPGISICFAGTTNLYDGELGLVLENFYDFRPAPQLPKDLKAKKTKLSSKTTLPKATTESTIETQELIEDLEEELVNDGLVDLETEEFI